MEEIKEGENTTVGRIKRLMRARNNMSKIELAENAGLTRGAVTNILNGNRSASVDSLEGIAVALGTTVDYLRLLTDNPFPSKGEPLPEYALDIIESLKRLDLPRGYELLVIARAWVEESQQISSLNLRHAISRAMDISDQLFDKETTDRIAEILGQLEANSGSLSSPTSLEKFDDAG